MVSDHRFIIDISMDIRTITDFTLIICWAYFSMASVTQQHGDIQYFDKRYISEARAFTGRRWRGDAYRTNVTIVTLAPMDNNVTIKIVADLKSIGTIVFHEMKVCDGLKIPWVKKIRDAYSNFTDCPIPVGRYGIFNVEVPPKHFPLPVPKGEGTLHMYCYLTQTKQLVLHALMKVVSS